ncbi:MAG: nucleotidyltransferase domain-containing protein, partial [Candidatus Thermoplasmatota archaeon]|nr:nucleotidyltransferase domain-containing protein [Candidatus Thermoplasmatota archaeon]
RIQILNYVLFRESVTVGKVAGDLGLSKGFVSDFLSLLDRHDIVQRDKGYRVVDSFFTRSIKVLLNLNKFQGVSLKKSYIKGVGIYGSWAHGTNTVDSDVDIWIKTDVYPDEKELAIFVKQIRMMVHAEVQLLVLTPQKVFQLKKDSPFYSALYHDSIVLWGEGID